MKYWFQEQPPRRQFTYFHMPSRRRILPISCLPSLLISPGFEIPSSELSSAQHSITFQFLIGIIEDIHYIVGSWFNDGYSRFLLADIIDCPLSLSMAYYWFLFFTFLSLHMVVENTNNDIVSFISHDTGRILYIGGFSLYYMVNGLFRFNSRVITVRGSVVLTAGRLISGQPVEASRPGHHLLAISVIS